MRSQKATKWKLWTALLICLGLGLYVFVSNPGRPEPTKIVSTTKLGKNGAIYEILYDSGGATVPFIYRYFLMERQANDMEILQKSKKATPFLVTKSTGAVRSVTDSSVDLVVSETVYDFQHTAHFKVNDTIKEVSFYLEYKNP